MVRAVYCLLNLPYAYRHCLALLNAEKENFFILTFKKYFFLLWDLNIQYSGNQMGLLISPVRYIKIKSIFPFFFSPFINF